MNVVQMTNWSGNIAQKPGPHRNSDKTQFAFPNSKVCSTTEGCNVMLTVPFGLRLFEQLSKEKKEISFGNPVNFSKTSQSN